jgi:hypothetical protein
MQFCGLREPEVVSQFSTAAYFYENVQENNLHEACLTGSVPRKGCTLTKHDLRASNIQVHRPS